MGPLGGLKIVEMAGIGPGPFAGMMFSDLGADVIRIDRLPKRGADGFESVKKPNIVDRGRRSIAVDLKAPAGVALALELIAQSDAVIEGFRPGVMERLGLGPEVCLAANPKLVFGRITGWGQQGPLADTAGHDINYIAISGALHAIGTGEAPLPPLNLVGDFGGGAMMLAFGVVCALWEAQRSGRGQVVDAAMTDGAAILMAMMYGFKANGTWRDARASNLLDGGAPFYGVYPCADGKFVAVGALEPQFFEEFVAGLGLDAEALGDRWKPQSWPAWRAAIAVAFLTRPRDAWAEVFADFRRLRDAGHEPGGSAGTPPQRRARNLRAWARRPATRARAPVLAHRGHARRAAVAPGRRRRGDPGRTRLFASPHRGVEGGRGDLRGEKRAQRVFGFRLRRWVCAAPDCLRAARECAAPVAVSGQPAKQIQTRQAYKRRQIFVYQCAVADKNGFRPLPRLPRGTVWPSAA